MNVFCFSKWTVPKWQEPKERILANMNEIEKFSNRNAATIACAIWAYATSNRGFMERIVNEYFDGMTVDRLIDIIWDIAKLTMREVDREEMESEM